MFLVPSIASCHGTPLSIVLCVSKSSRLDREKLVNHTVITRNENWSRQHFMNHYDSLNVTRNWKPPAQLSLDSSARLRVWCENWSARLESGTMCKQTQARHAGWAWAVIGRELPLLCWGEGQVSSGLMDRNRPLPKRAGSWVRINTTMALGIVWRDRIRARTRKKKCRGSSIALL